ncbi:hypothetical protein COLO4_07974 [Corchorus olitorius]|uniref:Disease resistance protein At4g27190-like leucine-rich repeats domain-containing protein n=1 Tax=Corchorus olitorius TaxID=93759 RepID=A0A1R3KI05_9ROSI|nr:hypothetical protein COLO4_07974 [Corchorus olitorius]
MPGRLQKLKKLEIYGCGSVEEIFEHQEIDARESNVVTISTDSDMVENIPKFEFPQVTILKLYNLPKLKSFFCKMHTKWPSLEKLLVRGCDKVEIIFANSEYQNFQSRQAEGEQRQLDIQIHQPLFWISKEVMFLDEFVKEGSILRVFPRLQEMVLRYLPKLVRFCFGDYIEFSLLSILEINNCPELTTFVGSNFVIGDESQVDPNIGRNNSNVLCLFNDKVAFPGLQNLHLRGNGGWKKIWHNNLPSSSFGELNSFVLDFCDGLSSIFPFNIVYRLSNLEKMEISWCDNLESIIEPFGLNSNDSESSAKFVFPQVSCLKLKSLSKLKSFYPRMHTSKWPALKELEVTGCSNIVQIFALKNRNSQLDDIPDNTFPCLTELRLEYNNNLREIWLGQHVDHEEQFQSRAQFSNLTTLQVFGCHKLESLVSSTMFFENLVTLEVSNCDGLKTLIIHPTAKSMIRLTRMGITYCQMIQEIVTCERQDVKEVITFANLKSLELGNLSSLLSFCSGSIDFEFLCLEEIGYHGVTHLVLSDVSKSIDIWKENLQASINFKYLQILEVHDCGSLTYIITSSMALSLGQLNDIKVKNCPMLEQVITNDRAEDPTVSRIKLPNLQFITLESCSSLTSFFLGSSMECPFLEQLTVVDCPKMFEFTSAVPRKQDLETIDGVNAPFFNDKHIFQNKATIILLD